MRFNSGLKEIKGSRSIRIRFHNFTACIMYRRHFVYKRNHITQEFHQTTHTHIFTCTNTEYGEHTTWSQSLTDTFTHFVFRQRFLFKEFLHQAFIVFCSSFHQCFVQFGCFFHFLCRNIFNGGCTTFGAPRIFFHQKYINQRIEVRSGSQRILHGNYLRTISRRQLLQYHIIITLLMVKLIHQENHRFT